MNNFLFVAAENDGVPHCKAGGMGDVVRDVPREISRRGDKVHVVTPSYNRLHAEGNLKMYLDVQLQGKNYHAELYEVKPKKEFSNLFHYVIHHPEITGGDIAHIYHNDLEEPFFTDTIKFIIFSTAVAEAIRQNAFGKLDIVHLHDWHTSLLLFLKKYNNRYQDLNNIRWVYTIHNLAIQGIRPFENNYSSLRNWFPEIEYDQKELQDPRYLNCINLMAVGIRLSDSLHTVSPSYKQDVLKPSHSPEFIGGEGLEEDLIKADKEGRFFGILNGCNYTNIRKAKRNQLFSIILKAIFKWLQQESKKYKADFLAHTGEKILPLLKNKPAFVCCSVARLTEQKFYIFKRSPDALVEMLQKLKEVNGIYILLGTGDPNYESLLRGMSYKYSNFIFINAQSEGVIDSLYLESNLYFMPSLFEPCGISQMLAMRNGQPCLVHYTGGLKDTVAHNETGFVFCGDTYLEMVENMVLQFQKTLDIFFNNKSKWKQIQKNAKEMRFTWKSSVDKYYELLYKLK